MSVRDIRSRSGGDGGSRCRFSSSPASPVSSGTRCTAATRHACLRRWSASRCRSSACRRSRGMAGHGRRQGLQRGGSRRRQADDPQCLGVMVRALPRRASAAHGSSPRSRASGFTASTTRTIRPRRGASSAASAILSPASAPTASGRTAIDFGVYGVPETYVISGDGKIAYRHVGPLTEEAIKEKLLPLVQSAGKPRVSRAGVSLRVVRAVILRCEHSEPRRTGHSP